ncbi:MAG: histidine kinase [Mucilaginibacter polytrichastri]|nr:histidine kinase [Mucilaginibacter polytrichastri]
MILKKLFRLLFPGLFGLMAYATIRLLQDTGTGARFWIRGWQLNLAEICISLLTGYVLVGIVRTICKRNDQRQQNGVPAAAMLRPELLTVIVTTLIAENVILMPFTALTDDGLSLSDAAFILTIPLLYTIVYYGVIRSRSYLDAYVEHKLLAEKLGNDQLQTELKFLKAQFHPHFLFNALNTIYFQIDDDVYGAKKSIELLSGLLRYQLYEREQEVSVSEEIAYLENYIELQKLRMSSKMRLSVYFDPTLRGQKIYPLLFLPFVENAFKHAGGTYGIDIRAENRGDHVVFTVKNDVPDAHTPAAKDSGIGLENLKRRLELLYPHTHTLTINRSGHTFTAELLIRFEA